METTAGEHVPSAMMSAVKPLDSMPDSSNGIQSLAIKLDSAYRNHPGLIKEVAYVLKLPTSGDQFAGAVTATIAALQKIHFSSPTDAGAELCYFSLTGSPRTAGFPRALEEIVRFEM
jgi:hypothetical protein